MHKQPGVNILEWPHANHPATLVEWNDVEMAPPHVAVRTSSGELPTPSFPSNVGLKGKLAQAYARSNMLSGAPWHARWRQRMRGE